MQEQSEINYNNKGQFWGMECDMTSLPNSQLKLPAIV